MPEQGQGREGSAEREELSRETGYIEVRPRLS
jgi:hypothetical protein